MENKNLISKQNKNLKSKQNKNLKSKQNKNMGFITKNGTNEQNKRRQIF
jgi:hypothetical protein